MRKFILTLLFLVLSLPAFCPPDGNAKPVNFDYFDIKRVDKLLQAIIYVESRGDSTAVNHRENAVGILQIRPIMVKEANRLGGKYVLEHRKNVAKSIELFYLVQQFHNPKYDPKIACFLWNGGQKHSKEGSMEYYNKVMRRLKQI